MNSDIEMTADIPPGDKKDSVIQSEGMYIGSYLFKPRDTDEITSKDIASLFAAMELRLGSEVFERLPKHLKRMFVIHTRDGKVQRYGERSF